MARQRPRQCARLTVGDERERLWQRWLAIEPEIDDYASWRSVETPVAIFEPRDATT
jgi:hypothetical protein